MNVLYVICLAVAAILAALAAFYQPPNPPPVHLLSLSVAFIALAFLLERLIGPV